MRRPETPSGIAPPAELALTVLTIGALDRHLRVSDSGMLIPTDQPVQPGDFVLVHLSLGALPYRATLTGHVVDASASVGWEHDRDRIVRVALSPESWERLKSLSLWLPWRRATDFDADVSNVRRPTRVETFCLVADLVDGVQGVLLDASERGAFLGLEADVRNGDVVWFKSRAGAEHERWHCATALWRGRKGEHYGVGVSLDLETPRAHEQWRDFLRAIPGR